MTCDRFTPKTTSLAECPDKLRQEVPMLSRERAEHDCRLGHRLRNNSASLNDRLRWALDSFRRSHPGTRPPALVNSFALTDGHCVGPTGCDACVAGDGIHFHKLLFDEIGLLARALVSPGDQYEIPASVSANSSALIV